MKTLNFPPSLPPPSGLLAWEIDSIDFFVRAADLLGLPKSIGQVYGLLFITPDPLSLDAIQSRLGISRGSTSQALQFLRRVHAIQPVFIPGDRKDHFRPELEMKKIVTGFLQEQIRPHLESGDARLQSIQARNGEIPDPIRRRLARLSRWRANADRLLPLIVNVLGG